MARTIDRQAHTERRNRILDAAERIIIARGYEQMSVQELLEDLRISKGAFYHYFDSKHALLEALVERRFEQAQRLLEPIVADPKRPALEKLRAVFAATAYFKTAQKTFLLSVLAVYLADGNAVFRQKMRKAKVKRLAPLLAQVIRQGIREGVFATSHPERLAEVVWCLEQDLSDSLGECLLSASQGCEVDSRRLEAIVTTYGEAVTRVLAAPENVLDIDAATLEEWLAAARERGSSPSLAHERQAEKEGSRYGE
jgi:AcrR family transcriptional regulator